MLIMRITDFIRECFCRHEWLVVVHYTENPPIDVCKKCGKILW